MKVYAVVYATFWDSDKIFLHRKDAKACMRLTRKQLKLEKGDGMLRVVPLEVHERFDPEKFKVKQDG